jgi:hypothetical protein
MDFRSQRQGCSCFAGDYEFNMSCREVLNRQFPAASVHALRGLKTGTKWQVNRTNRSSGVLWVLFLKFRYAEERQSHSCRRTGNH